jgi:hypothetical protein
LTTWNKREGQILCNGKLTTYLFDRIFILLHGARFRISGILCLTSLCESEKLTCIFREKTPQTFFGTLHFAHAGPLVISHLRESGRNYTHSKAR